MRQESAELVLARENQMLDRLCTVVKEFYSNDKNIQAYEAWKKNKEVNQNEKEIVSHSCSCCDDSGTV